MILFDKFHLWKTVQTHLLYFRELQLSPNQTRWKLIAVRQPPVIVYISLSAAFTIICQHTLLHASLTNIFRESRLWIIEAVLKSLYAFREILLKAWRAASFELLVLWRKTSSMHLLFIRVYQKTIIFCCGWLL